MATQTIIKEQNKVLKNLLTEIRAIKSQLDKFLFLIPEDSIKRYDNNSQIMENYTKALKSHPPVK